MGNPSTTSAIRKPVVLIIEDDADSREMYQLALADMGFQALTVSNAEDGFARACEVLPDAIVADVSLPSASGLDLTSRLRADSRTKEASIIVLSGHAQASVRQRATAAGCDRYLVKPCLPDALANEIHDVLNSRQARFSPDGDR